MNVIEQTRNKVATPIMLIEKNMVQYLSALIIVHWTMKVN